MIVGLTRKVHLFYIVLTRNLFSLFTARGIATKGTQHGLVAGGMAHMIEDKETNSQGLV